MTQDTLARVLIVDDHRRFDDLPARFLRRRGYEVSVAMTAETALELVQDLLPDIVLLNVGSARINGLALLEQILERTVGVGVITMATAAEEDVARKSLELGATDFVLTPLNLNYLETAVLARVTLGRA